MTSLGLRYRWVWGPRWRARAFAAAVSALTRVLGWLPAALRLAIKRSLTIVQRMDYPAPPVLLHVDSWVEYEKRTRSAAKEPEMAWWIEHCIEPGSVVFDIGANVGAYALAIARATGGKATVYAFEPSFATFAQLSRNVFLNGCHGAVIPIHAALSERTGLASLLYRSLDSGEALHQVVASGAEERWKCVYRQPVLSYTLDDFIAQFSIPHPHHIKLDVDGIEYAVLGGAGRTLANPRLRSVLVETEEGREGASLIRGLLERAGFRLRAEYVHNQNPFHPGPFVSNLLFAR